MSMPDGAAATATVTAGQTATYNVIVASIPGFGLGGGAISISCSGAPPGARCNTSTASLPLPDNNPETVVVSVSTTAATASFPERDRYCGGLWLRWQEYSAFGCAEIAQETPAHCVSNDSGLRSDALVAEVAEQVAAARSPAPWGSLSSCSSFGASSMRRRAEGPRADRVGRRGTARTGDIAGLPRRHRHRDAARHRDRAARVDGQLMAVHFLEGQVVGGAICSPRSTRGRSRCSSSRRRAARARPGAPRERAGRRAALPRAREGGLDPEAAARHAGGARAPVRGRDRDRSAARSTPRSCTRPTAASRRPSAAASASAGRSPATWCTRADTGGLASSRSSSRSPWCSRSPRTASRPSWRSCGRRDAWRSRRSTARQRRKLASGTLLTVDNQIDPTTGTVRAQGEFPNNDERAVPEPVRQRAAAARDAARRDAGAVGRRPARRAGHVRLRRAGRPDGRDAARDGRRGRGRDASVDEGVAPGELVVVDGAERLAAGAKVGRSRGAQAAPHA